MIIEAKRLMVEMLRFRLDGQRSERKASPLAKVFARIAEHPQPRLRGRLPGSWRDTGATDTIAAQFRPT